MLLGELVERTARETPDRPALLFEDRSITWGEIDLQVRRTASGLRSLGLGRGDRVAIMLPNTPEFVYAFFGVQRIGAVAVPFNTMYKGGEVAHILSDAGARAVVALVNFAPLINEILPELPDLEHVILTGERNVIFADPEATAFVSAVVDARDFESHDDAYRRVGETLTDLLADLGVTEAWYKHRGSLRVQGRKIAGFLVQAVEDLYVISAVLFLDALDVEPFTQVIWVPQEIKDKVLEPHLSVADVTGCRPSDEALRDAAVRAFEKHFGVRIEEAGLDRDEAFGYEKLRTQLGPDPS